MAALATQVATNSAKLDAHDDDVLELRKAIEGLARQAQEMLRAIKDDCDKNTARVERKVDKQTERLDALTAAQRWTPMQWAALLGPWGAAAIAALGVVLTKGAP